MNRPPSIARPSLPVLGLLLGLAAAPLHAQTATQPVVYPAKGQSSRQQDQDRYECHTWARGQSGGYDPTQVPAPVPAPSPAAAGANANANGSANAAAPRPSIGAPVSGMAAGAMSGAAIAELTDRDPGHAAAAGALGGGLLQRVKQSQAAQQQATRLQAAQQQSLQQQNSARSQQRTTYERAMSACMEGRGYTVK